MYIVEHATKEQMLKKYNEYDLNQLKIEKTNIEKTLKEDFKNILKHKWTFNDVVAKPSFVLFNEFNFWWDLYKEIISMIEIKKTLN